MSAQHNFAGLFNASRTTPAPTQQPQHPQTHATYVGNNRVLLRNSLGLKMFVDSRDLSLTPHLILDGYWELWNTMFLRWLLKPGMNFVEVGSNLGYFTLLASQAVGPTGKVFALDANPAMVKFTRDNLNINGFLSHAKAIHAAAYSERTKLKFSCFRDHMAGSSLFVGAEHATRLADEIEVIEVDAIPLDEIVPPGQRVDVIKIDAEGAELHCLKGASRVLAENPNVFLMLEHAAALVSGDGNTPKTALYDFCVDLGMRCYQIAPDGKLIPSDFPALESAGLCDIVCTRSRL